MPLRHGASRSRSEAGGEKSRMSMQSLMASERHVRMTITLAGRSEQKASANNDNQESLSSEAPAPCWWALIDSGMLSTGIFFIAMILYLASIPPYNCIHDPETYYYSYRYYSDHNSCVPSYHVSSWLYLVAAALFILEAGMDVMWGLKRMVVQSSLQKAQKELGIPATGRPSAASTLAGRSSAQAPFITEDSEIPLTAYDTVPWDLFAAILFVIGSVFYLVSSLIDKNCVNPPWTWLIIGSDDKAAYSVLVCKIAAVIFIFDSIVGLMGRVSYFRTTPPEDRLVVLALWKAKGFFEIDFGLWGDLLFFAGAIVGAYQQFNTYSEPLDWLVESLWTLDAFFYMLACWPTMKSMMKPSSSS